MSGQQTWRHTRSRLSTSELSKIDEGTAILRSVRAMSRAAPNMTHFGRCTPTTAATAGPACSPIQICRRSVLPACISSQLANMALAASTTAITFSGIWLESLHRHFYVSKTLFGIAMMQILLHCMLDSVIRCKRSRQRASVGH